MDNTELDKIETDINNNNAVEERMRNLHKAKKDAEDQAEAARKAKEASDAELSTLKKEASFLNSFSDINAKFPGASEYKDKIKEKFALGYSVEDATISTLVSEGKYTAPQAPRENVAGGSAPNQITQPVNKTVKEMSSTERWAALAEAERRGDIGLS